MPTMKKKNIDKEDEKIDKSILDIAALQIHDKFTNKNTQFPFFVRYFSSSLSTNQCVS